ncbi:MAG: HEAT repeat domain-containing protein, partial [Myxococcota bacterium]
DRPAWRALAERLDDPAPEVRRAAARALEVLSEPASRAALATRWRVEDDPWVRGALRDASRATRDAPAPGGFALRGDQVLRMRVAAAEAHHRMRVDVVLPDGRWLRLRTLPSGELLWPGLPAGKADVRVRLGS